MPSCSSISYDVEMSQALSKYFDDEQDDEESASNETQQVFLSHFFLFPV